MHSERQDLRQLAARIQTGDADAATQLVKEIEPQVRRMVRHVIRTRSSGTAFARRIAAEVGQLSAQAGCNGSDLGRLINEVSGRICNATIEGLRYANGEGRKILETMFGHRLSGTTLH